MITRPVVLILGAGASKPYGFPLGKELFDQVVQGTPDREGLLEKARFSAEIQRQFIAELRMSLRTSVDAFLESRPDFIEVGKAIIAYHLIGCEDERSLYYPGNPQDWFRYLFSLMVTPDFESFRENKISFITFNYDRSLEYLLLNALKSNYNKPSEEAAEMLKHFNIIHFHGKLGELLEFDPKGRLYNTALSLNALQAAQHGIRIIHEDVSKEPWYLPTLNLLGQGNIVIFLGFGYHPTNMNRLTVKDRVQRDHLWGTTYGLTPEEIRSNVMSLLPQELSSGRLKDMQVLEFLRHHVFLFKR